MPPRTTLLLLNNTSRPHACPEIVDRFAGEEWRVEERWAAGGEFPDEVGDYDAIYLSGSPHGAYEEIDWIRREHRLIEGAGARGIPMFGVCFGSQILASALCGRDQVFRRSGCEVGYLRLDTTAQARSDALCAGLGRRPRLFVWHNDEVRPDHPDVVVLGTTLDCPNQIWRHRSLSAWGVQGHVEITRAEAPAWFERNRARLERDGADVGALIAEADDAAEAKTMLREFLRFSRRRAVGDGEPWVSQPGHGGGGGERPRPPGGRPAVSVGLARRRETADEPTTMTTREENQ